MYAHVLNRCEFSYMSFLEYALRRVAVSILEERCFFFFFFFKKLALENACRSTVTLSKLSSLCSLLAIKTLTMDGRNDW